MTTTTSGLRSRRTTQETQHGVINVAPSKRAQKRRGIRAVILVFAMVVMFILILALLVTTSGHNNAEPMPIIGLRPIMTAYMEDPSALNVTVKPLPPRRTTTRQLTPKQFPAVTRCSSLFESFPIDDFPLSDPFLPWIHDIFPDSNGLFINVVAQNRRRCQTGKGMEDQMKFWEPQMALFQPVPVVLEKDRIRLASSLGKASVKETRFICRFHSLIDNSVFETFSSFPFNYEYCSWRKGFGQMFQREGKDHEQFWLSQLLFRCPIPKELRKSIVSQNHIDHSTDMSRIFVDIIPIRTQVRFGNFLFTEDHVGKELISSVPLFDLQSEFGDQHFLPIAEDSGRWANIPICRPPPILTQKHRLVACTWTSSSYSRRGDVVGINDTEARVREWILFHKMVGFDRLYLYDNTARNTQSSLGLIAAEFPDFVTYHRWPCSICNNNRPAHQNPGERSSQYAAEASCRERYGQSTDWMTFIDTDEYLIPMANDTWKPLLDHFDNAGIRILKMRSSRAKPRIEFMTPIKDQSKCIDPVPSSKKPPGKPQQCLEPAKNKTFLQVYNCEFIRSPKPERFERAMKQIYRPDYVQSHFVHYSTVTKDVSKYWNKFSRDEAYVRNVHRRNWKHGSPETFLDELTQGVLLHARSVLPHETKYREQGCQTGSKYGCDLGHVCPDTTQYIDEMHQKKVFVDEQGRFCDCWKNQRVENIYVPKLNELLKQHMELTNAANVLL